MKKIILTLAILASVLSANAFNNYLLKETINISILENFKEVAIDKLPETVVYAVVKDYANATLIKAYKNSQKQYKLELKIEETVGIVYTDEDGNWIDEKEITSIPKQ